MSKLIRELTDEELLEEWLMWDKKIKNATSWGAALTAADEFRRACKLEINRRNKEKEVQSDVR